MSVVLQYTYQNSQNMNDLNRQIYDLSEKLKSKFLECADTETTDEISLKVQQEGDLASQRYAQLTLKTTESEAKLSLLATYDLSHASVTVSAALVNGIEQSNITLEGDQIYLKGDTIIGNGFKLSGDHIVANTITATQIASKTITAAEIKSGTITATQIAGNTITAAEIATGTITANEIAAHTITAAEISTSYVYAGSISANQITAGNLNIGNNYLTIGGYSIYSSSGGLTTTYLSTSSLSVSYSASINDLWVDYDVRLPGLSVSTDTPNIYRDPYDNGKLYNTSASSRKIKHDIKPIEDEDLLPKNLYDIPVVQFVYNDNYLSEKDLRYHKAVPGFIAEDIKELYPIACDADREGNARDWNVRYIVPPMLALIQDLNKRVKRLEEV